MRQTRENVVNSPKGLCLCQRRNRNFGEGTIKQTSCSSINNRAIVVPALLLRISQRFLLLKLAPTKTGATARRGKTAMIPERIRIVMPIVVVVPWNSQKMPSNCYGKPSLCFYKRLGQSFLTVWTIACRCTSLRKPWPQPFVQSTMSTNTMMMMIMMMITRILRRRMAVKKNPHPPPTILVSIVQEYLTMQCPVQYRYNECKSRSWRYTEDCIQREDLFAIQVQVWRSSTVATKSWMAPPSWRPLVLEEQSHLESDI